MSDVKIDHLVVGPLETNCYILGSSGELAVIDPGGDPETILARIEQFSAVDGDFGKYSVDEADRPVVKYVINTHGHVDHVAADREILQATGAQLVIGELDAIMLEHPEASLAVLVGQGLESLKPDVLLRDGDELFVGSERLRVIHTPGHTPGSITLLGDGYAFTGDTLFLDSIGRTDFPGGSERQMRYSLQRLQSLLDKETVLYPGHGQSGTMGRALLVNPFLGGMWPW